MTKKGQVPVEEAIKYADTVEPFALEHGGQGLSKNEERIVILANEVKRLRARVEELT